MTLRDKMLDVIANVNGQLAEREELVEMIAIALLSRKNLFILGAPGQAKSYAINCFRSRIKGARQFERLLSKQTDEEQVFGRIDLASLIPGSVPEAVFRSYPEYRQLKAELDCALGEFRQHMSDSGAKEKLDAATERMKAFRDAVSALHCTGEPTVQTAGKLPEADICFLDEIFKCNDGMLNSLLTALNERKYTNEGHTYSIPTISFFAASNEMGDMIVCLDESLSTAGDDAAWGKAVALTLLDIAADSKRSFALIHFSGHGSFRTDVFRPGSYSAQDKMDAAECFLSGGTDFETPLKEAVRLMGEDGFENADVVFITDGNCALPEGFSEQLCKAQAENGFSVTGVLLDAGSPSWEFSLKSFCQKTYRTSELMGEEIVRSLVSDRV